MMSTFFHITNNENVASLLANGADPARIGVNTLKNGPGFHLTPKYPWAEEWGRTLFPSPFHQTAILQVTLPETARFATGQEKPERSVLERWGKAQGYLEKDGRPSRKLFQAAHQENWPEDSDYFLEAIDVGVYFALLGVYLMVQGFDGYWVHTDLVITNFALLGPDTFTIATGMHQQKVTLQDVETGHFITLKLSPGANGLMVYCYQNEQVSGEPLASFQVASYRDQLEILYWDATMSDEQDPKRLILAEHIPIVSRDQDQSPENRQ